MSGPGLSQKDAHHAIHQAAFHEAEQLTLALRQALRAGDQQHALQLAAVLIEHWQTRTLRHADAEETGWYRELLAERPELHDDIIALTRDHELLRILMAEIQGIFSARGIAAGIVERFEAMLLLNGIHSRTEEHRLLGGEGDDVAPGIADSAHHVSSHRDPPSAAMDSDLQQDAPEHDAGAAPIPLAVARPVLYERLSGLLRERGLHGADILPEVLAEADGHIILRVAYGAGYTRVGKWPLPEKGADAATTEDTMLREIVATCERATQEDYHARMRTPT